MQQTANTKSGEIMSGNAKLLLAAALLSALLLADLSVDRAVAQGSAQPPWRAPAAPTGVLPQLKNIGAMIANGEPRERYLEAWERVIQKSKNLDIPRAVNVVTNQAMQQLRINVADRRSSVQSYQMLQKEISNEIITNRLILRRSVAAIPPVQTKLFFGARRGAQPYFMAGRGSIVRSRAELEKYIASLDEKLKQLGDDAQLANVDLQNILEKQQRTISEMSEISKMLRDTAMAVIRKMGG